MISTTKTATAALILTVLPALSPSLLASDIAGPRGRAAIPLRDDALDHAMVEPAPDVVPDPEPEPEPEAEAVATADPGCYGDPYGFAAVLNSFRASAGLPPVAYCPDLSAWASQNNSAQCSFGLGHHVMANFFQNSGYNQASVFQIAQSWMSSPAHAQNMLAPSATRFGIAFGPGPYWTLNLQ